MVKHTETIRWLTAYELFECVWLFCEVAPKRLKEFLISWVLILRGSRRGSHVWLFLGFFRLQEESDLEIAKDAFGKYLFREII